MSVTNRTTIGVSILILGVTILGLWWIVGPDAPDEVSGSTSAATPRDFSVTVQAIGAVKPQIGAEVRVGSRISGRVVSLYTNIGDHVKKGDVIAELEREELEAVVAERRAQLQMAQAKLQAANQLFPQEIERAAAEVDRWRATATLAELEFVRGNELITQGLISEQGRDQVEEQLGVARAELEAANRTLDFANADYAATRQQTTAEIEQARAALARVEAQLSYATLTAPISGVIGSVSTQEGETVAAGLNAPTFVTILDLSRLKVDAFVDEIDIGKVHSGQRANFTVDAHPGMEFTGSVSAIHPKAIIHDNIVKYIAEIAIETSYEGYLRPEMTASVDILIEPRTALAVRAVAIKREGGRDVVYVHSPDGPVLREVRIGWRSGPWAEIVSGLDEGEVVYLEIPITNGR